MPNGKVDEGEIALIIGEGGLKKATLARRKRIRAHFQAFSMENYQEDLAELINGPKEDLGKAVCAFLSKDWMSLQEQFALRRLWLPSWELRSKRVPKVQYQYHQQLF